MSIERALKEFTKFEIVALEIAIQDYICLLSDRDRESSDLAEFLAQAIPLERKRREQSDAY